MRWRFILILAMFLAEVLPAANAEAAVRPHAFYLTPQAGAYFFNRSQDLKDSPIYGLGIGYQFSSHWSSEIDTSFVDSRRETGQRLDVGAYLLRLDILYHFRPDRDFVPYFAVGIGGLLFDFEGGGTDLDGFVDYGIGMQYFLSHSIALRLDGRHLFTAEDIHFDGKEYQNFLVSAGLAVHIGGDEKQPEIIDTDGDGVIDSFDRCPDTPLGVPVDGYGCPVDRDRDGIADYLDKCPNTPVGAPVDKTGCPLDGDRDGIPDYLDHCPATPAGTKVDGSGCPPLLTGDADGDGVTDSLDRCPDTPPKTPVNLYGCPIDADGDGVADLVDKCPATPAGTFVDTHGCPTGELQSMAGGSLDLNLEFAPGNADFRPEFEQQLQAAVHFIRDHPGERILIEGHTDSVGPADANLRLSQARADCIRRYLIEKSSIAPELIQARGYGETRPVTDNSSQEGRARNRRVVIRLAGGG